MMKTALIAGGTSGVGLSIAKALLRKEYEVYLLGQNKPKGEAIEMLLNKSFSGNAHFIRVDLSNISEVKSFSKNFSEKHDKLDVLANVAGVMEETRKITKEGFEKTFAVGYLSAFVLATQLAPLLEKASHARIVNVAGVASFVFKAKLDFDDLTFSQNYSSFKTAITTIHAKTILTEILADKYASIGVDVNSFHPGAVRSNLMNNMGGWKGLLFRIVGKLMSQDSKTGIYASCSAELEGVTGKYLDKKKIIDLNFDNDYKQQLWDESEKLIRSVS
ncbi:MAG: SDR family NAD(P)-dependent oxidoreductase [Hyphomicrobiales bacterium]|nr:SDR family NAD(P)-dependent oxidoreductase [Hyphomicrobiales bacterium]